MPRTDGIYAVPSGTKGVTLQAIQSGKYNGFLDDITNDLNAARPVGAGGTGATTPDGAAEALGLISAKDIAGVNTVGGTANAITIVTSRGYDAYEATLYLGFRAASDVAAGGATIDLDGNGTKPLYKTVAAGLVDVNAGDILATGYYWITYDPAANAGGGAFILLNPGNASSAYQVGDFLDTARTLNSDWLKRDGGIYLIADYPELAALLPALPDGMGWTAITSGATTIVRSIISRASEFLLVEDDGTNTKIRKSTDGDTWSLAATISSYRGYCTAFGAGVYVIGSSVAAQVVASADGVTWGAPATITGFGADVPIAIAYGLGVFVAVGSGGKISTSPDATTWTSRTSGTTQSLFGVSFINNIFVAVGTNGTILTSPDAINWTARTSGVTVLLHGAAFGSGLYVVVGDNGTILTSSNMTSWTSRASGTTQGLNAIAYSAAGFLTVGLAGTVRISTGGTSWSTPDATGTSSRLEAVCVDANNPAKYYTGGYSGAVLRGLRTLPTQFQAPNDNPTYGWIKAVS